MSGRGERSVFDRQYWKQNNTWSERYNVQLSRLWLLEAKAQAAHAAREQCYRLWRGYPEGSAKSDYYLKQMNVLEHQEKRYRELADEQRRHLHRIEDGWIEP